MREKATYRDNLEDLLAFTGGGRLLNLSQVAKYLGIDRRTAEKRYQIGKEGITAPTLARMLSK